MAQANKIESIKIQKTIPALSTDVIRERLKSAGTIVEVSGKFYQGQELKLQVRPVLEKSHETIVDLYTYPVSSNQFMAGDNQEYNDAMSFEVDNDDNILIYCINTADFPCTVSMTITVDYYAGKARVV